MTENNQWLPGAEGMRSTAEENNGHFWGDIIDMLLVIWMCICQNSPNSTFKTVHLKYFQLYHQSIHLQYLKADFKKLCSGKIITDIIIPFLWGHVL